MIGQTFPWFTFIREVKSRGSSVYAEDLKPLTFMHITEIATLLKNTKGMSDDLLKKILDQLYAVASTSNRVDINSIQKCSQEELMELRHKYNYSVGGLSANE